jgi:hypothetical protein
MKRRPSSHSLSLALAVGPVTAALGLLSGCTVAKANVRAAGKEVMIDKAGRVTFNEEAAVKTLPCYTDEKFLDTLMSAAKVAGTRIKAREDHDDSIGARAGYFDAFQKTNDGRVVADCHLFDSYRNRAIVIEAAASTPEEIGLSIDFVPDFEIVGDRALMRVRKLLAVDIVDEGAITPDGLYLSASVNTGTKERTDQSETLSTSPTMPDEKKTEPTITEVMAALSALSSTVAALAAAKPAAVECAPDAMAAVNAEILRLSNAQKANDEKAKATDEKLAAVTADNLKLKKTATALGFRVTASPADRVILTSQTASVEDIEKLNDSTPKDYSAIVDERVASTKCKRSEAHFWAMKAHPEEYRAQLKARGIYDPAKAKLAAK